jgi:hypothetical protein
MKKPEVSSPAKPTFALTLRNLRKEILLNESFVEYYDFTKTTLKELIFLCKVHVVLTSDLFSSFSSETLKELDSIYLELISRKAPFALKVKREQFSSWLVANKNSIQELKEFFNVK